MNYYTANLISGVAAGISLVLLFESRRRHVVRATPDLQTRHEFTMLYNVYTHNTCTDTYVLNVCVYVFLLLCVTVAITLLHFIVSL